MKSSSEQHGASTTNEQRLARVCPDAARPVTDVSRGLWHHIAEIHSTATVPAHPINALSHASVAAIIDSTATERVHAHPPTQK